MFEENMTRKSSRRTLKSLVVNSKNHKKQTINLQLDEIVSLPNKQFINSDGTQISILKTQHQEFSPLI